MYVVERKSDGARLVAKVLRHALAENSDLVRRMRREARALQLLDHPNIVRIVDFDDLGDGRPFIVTELLEGRTLNAAIRDRAFDVDSAAEFTRQILLALRAVHRLKIVHRDLTPRNLFMHLEAGRLLIKVLDFGFSKFLGHASSDLLTREGMLVGTPGFTAPEAVRGDRVDEQADLYAAGIVLFMLLTGEHPFDDLMHSRQMYLAHVWRPMPAPSALRHGISQEMDAVVARALAKRSEDRYASADEFLVALDVVTGAPNAQRSQAR